MIEQVSSFGFKSLVFNFRGCSDSIITTPQLYSASYTKDLNIVVKYVHDILGRDAVLYGCGFSMGANILLKYSGEMADDCPFSGLVSIANPFDLTSTNFEVQSSVIKRNIYSQKLAKNLIRVLKKHLHVFEGNDMYDLPKIFSSRYIKLQSDILEQLWNLMNILLERHSSLNQCKTIIIKVFSKTLIYRFMLSFSPKHQKTNFVLERPR